MKSAHALVLEARFREVALIDPHTLSDEENSKITEAFLEFGEVARARVFFDAIQNVNPAIRHRLEDAEEAMKLGESVYPSHTPMSDRWVTPACVDAARTLESWRPGRILHVDSTHVEAVFVDPKTQILGYSHFEMNQWRAFAPFIVPRVDLFLFVLVYDDDLVVVLQP